MCIRDRATLVLCIILGFFFRKSFRAFTVFLVVVCFGGCGGGVLVAGAHSPSTPGVALFSVAFALVIFYLGVRVIKHVLS